MIMAAFPDAACSPDAFGYLPDTAYLRDALSVLVSPYAQRDHENENGGVDAAQQEAFWAFIEARSVVEEGFMGARGGGGREPVWLPRRKNLKSA